MSISIINNPGTYSPASAENWIVLSSTFSSNTNFKYTIDINRVYPGTSSYTRLASAKLPPRPDNGYGVYSPSKVLSSQLTYDLQPSIRYITAAPNSLLSYNYTYGNQDDAIITGHIATTAFPIFDFLIMTFSNPAPDLEVGDIITIDKNNKLVNPSYDGTASILLTATGSYFAIVTDIAAGPSIYADDVTITSVQRAGLTSSTFYSYNGTRQYDETDVDFSDYVTRNDNLRSYFLSNYAASYDPTKYKTIGRYDFETLSIISEANLYTEVNVVVNAWGVTYSTSATITASASTSDLRYDIPVGGGNFLSSGLFGTNSRWDLVTDYSISLYSVTYSYHKAIRYYKINNICSPYETRYKMAFLNRWGAFDYFDFNYKSSRTLTNSKKEYKKIFGYNSSIGDRGRTVLSQRVNESVSVSSYFIREDESKWLNELISSPEVYVIDNPLQISLLLTDAYNRLVIYTTTPHNFKIGDVITMNQFYGYTEPLYNTNHTIISILKDDVVVTSTTFTTSLTNGGIVYKSTPNVYPVIVTTSNHTAKNLIDDKMFSMSLTFEWANNINTQNQ